MRRRYIRGWTARPLNSPGRKRSVGKVHTAIGMRSSCTETSALRARCGCAAPCAPVLPIGRAFAGMPPAT